MLVSIADTIERALPRRRATARSSRSGSTRTGATTCTWGWQQNRAVVGHNLKIAWNLMRIHHMRPQRRLRRRWPTRSPDDARGRQRPAARRLVRRGRARSASRATRATPLHLARPQGVVAAGAGDPRLPDHGRLDRRRRARSASAARRPPSTTPSSSTTTRASVYFNVLANGIPYLLGTERQKGSHSMAGYHSFELAYLATVYTQPAHHQGADGPLLQPDPGRPPRRHPAGLAGHPAAGQHPDRRGRGRRQAVRRLRRRRPDRPRARRQEAGQDQGPRRADHRSVRGAHRSSTATSPR